MSERLTQYGGTARLGKWMQQKAFKPLADLPRYLVPAYFDAIVSRIYLALLGRTWSLMSKYVLLNLKSYLEPT